MGLTETRLNDDISDLYGLPVYQALNKCRQNRPWGCITLFIDDFVTFRSRVDLSSFDDELEIRGIEIEKGMLQHCGQYHHTADL